MPKLLISIGIVLILTGIAWQLGWHKHIPLGRLPGDIYIDKGNFKFYFPLSSCILLSIVVLFIRFLINQFR